MGMQTSATNQNTQDQLAHWTKMAPMMSPSTVQGRLVSNPLRIQSPIELTIPDSAAAAKHANGAGLLRGLREDVDEKCQGGRDGHGSGYATERAQDNERDLARYESGADR